MAFFFGNNIYGEDNSVLKRLLTHEKTTTAYQKTVSKTITLPSTKVFLRCFFTMKAILIFPFTFTAFDSQRMYVLIWSNRPWPIKKKEKKTISNYYTVSFFFFFKSFFSHFCFGGRVHF